jgi:hypothetical protein
MEYQQRKQTFRQQSKRIVLHWKNDMLNIAPESPTPPLKHGAYTNKEQEKGELVNIKK